MTGKEKKNYKPSGFSSLQLLSICSHIIVNDHSENGNTRHRQHKAQKIGKKEYQKKKGKKMKNLLISNLALENVFCIIRRKSSYIFLFLPQRSVYVIQNHPEIGQTLDSQKTSIQTLLLYCTKKMHCYLRGEVLHFYISFSCFHVFPYMYVQLATRHKFLDYE